MKAPQEWSVEELHHHLQHAVDLELWTIPLYLSAIYSIQGLDQIENKANYPDAAKLILSVVIQEMLHLELVCNLSRAVGHNPTFRHPNYDDGDKIPFIHPSPIDLPEAIRDYRVKVGGLDKQQLKLFCAIEFPHKPRTTPWSERQQYDSIGEFYEALQGGLSALWDECFVPGPQVSPQFNGYTHEGNVHVGFSQTITDIESAMSAIQAIVAQGEGVSHETVPREFEPPSQDLDRFDPGWFEPTLSHYQKFRNVLSHGHLPSTYSVSDTDTKESKMAQLALSQDFSSLLDALTKSFSNNSSDVTNGFYDSMFNIGKSITTVWRSGSVPCFSQGIATT
jgi:hypothetical protein